MTVRDIFLGVGQGVSCEPDTYLILCVLEPGETEGFCVTTIPWCALWPSLLACWLFPCNHCVRASHAEATGVVVEEEATMKSSLLVCVSLQGGNAALF